MDDAVNDEVVGRLKGGNIADVNIVDGGGLDIYRVIPTKQGKHAVTGNMKPERLPLANSLDEEGGDNGGL